MAKRKWQIISIAVAAIWATAHEAASQSANKGKRADCREQIAALKGTERLDAWQICLAQARLDCTKDAVAKKIAPSKRKEFVTACFDG